MSDDRVLGEGEPTLAELIADAARVHLPTLPAPRSSTPARPILTIPAPRTIEIPSAGISLVEGYADYGCS